MPALLRVATLSSAEPAHLLRRRAHSRDVPLGDIDVAQALADLGIVAIDDDVIRPVDPSQRSARICQIIDDWLPRVLETEADLCARSGTVAMP